VTGQPVRLIVLDLLISQKLPV